MSATDATEVVTRELGTTETFDVPHHGARPLLAPADDDAWRAALALAREHRLACLVVGSGSRVAWTNPAERVDLVLSTRAYAGVVAYEPGDGTLTARAGTTLDALRETVAAGGHHLTPDVARATLGGALAGGRNGLDRLRYGPARHNVLGMRVLEADGSITKTGAPLVKNVTGYDLHRLYTGSHGALCVVLEASLRLYPLPERRVALVERFATRERAVEVARELDREAIHPTAVVVEGTSLHVFLAGRDEVVAWERERVAAHLGAAHEVLENEGERAAYARLRDADAAPGTDASLEIACRPSRAGRVAAELASVANGFDLGWTIHPLVASLRIDVPEGALRPLARRLLDGGEPLAGATWHWRGGADESDAFGPPSPALDLMRELRTALDPTGVFCTGRLHGRI